MRNPRFFETSRSGIRGVVLLLAAVLGMLAGVGCETTDTVLSAGDASSAARAMAVREVVLAEGDSIRVNLPNAPEYNTVQKIRTDGKVFLPLIGEVEAAGRRIDAVQAEVASRYLAQTNEVRALGIVVSLESSGSSYTLAGGVKTPGKYPISQPITLLEAILGDGGGFTDFAHPSKVRLIRVLNGRYRIENIDMRGALKGEVKAIYLKPGDLIFVPETGASAGA